MKQVNTTTRVGTTAEWASGPTLDPGEQGYDTDKKILKVGDGTTAFASLDSQGGGSSRTGQTTLVAGTKVVADARVTAASKIFASVHTPGGTPGWLQISARVAGTSFTILSSSNTDTSVVDYLIIEP
jgi:hypothetical protein